MRRSCLRRQIPNGGGNSMLRALCFTTTSVFLSLAFASAQVQTVGDVSFAVPDGWQYQRGPDFGAMTLKTDNRFWLAAVYSAMPSSGDPNADFKTAWKRVVFSLPDYRKMPGYDPYNTSKMIGYSGKYYDASSATNTSYTRLSVLETGKAFVPVSFTSPNRDVLDSMSHNERAIVGSVRVVPRKASPIKFSLTVSDLEGYWTGGIVTSTDRLLQQFWPIPEQLPHGRQLWIHDCLQRHLHIQIRRTNE